MLCLAQTKLWICIPTALFYVNLDELIGLLPNYLSAPLSLLPSLPFLMVCGRLDALFIVHYKKNLEAGSEAWSRYFLMRNEILCCRTKVVDADDGASSGVTAAQELSKRSLSCATAGTHICCQLQTTVPEPHYSYICDRLFLWIRAWLRRDKLLYYIRVCFISDNSTRRDASLAGRKEPDSVRESVAEEKCAVADSPDKLVNDAVLEEIVEDELDSEWA